MLSPARALQKGYDKIKREWRLAFLAAFVTGLLIHMPAMLSDIPNHDGLSSIYFDQNMITSGRWFLMVACGFSSFYTIPWVIGLLGLFFLGLAAAALTELLEIRKSWAIAAVSGLLVAFPALVSTFAYVFTLDGYMLALLLAVLAVLFTKKYRYGFLPGGFCLAFSLGTYQGYLAFAMILSVFSILMLAMDRMGTWEKVKKGLRYLYMGVLGAVLYYVILQVLLQLQGKELDSYQGISGLSPDAASSAGIFSRIAGMYRDFAGFSARGNVLFNNWISAAAWILLACAALAAAVLLATKRKWWKSPWFFVIIVVALFALPLVTNIILLVSPSVTYHLLMRYQWVLFPIGLVAFVDRQAEELRGGASLEWAVFGAVFVLVFFYGVTDNIGYSNLQKRYEKTYAYCVRLLDRIEQTPGYYPGIPIAMVGVVGYEQFPETDITASVTSGMIGIYGDSLLYTGENYRLFIQHYLGATLNILPAEAMADMYFDEEYIAMNSFPGENSVRIINGIMYIKTENMHY
ncbi:MAG: glucosyltransferase domain-containing protein [Acetatifactor sp.]|nr:glucosyltransferase domain-containing protein [Acetatifactor sp.]